MNVVCIIPARGGSKRLLRKNVLSFCGLPLVEWSILQACCSHGIGPENTYLSTDDDEIASIGEKHNIHIIRRPDWPNPDKLSAGEPIKHAIKEIRKKRKIEAIINTLPTSPIRFPKDFDRLIKRYEDLEKIYPDCKEVDWTIPQRETVVHKYMDDARMMFYLLDKNWYFGQEGIASHIYEVEHYIKSTDIAEDKDLLEANAWMRPGKAGRLLYYIRGQWFQQFEIDDQDSFELCEIMMNRYILKGRGAKVYEEYARSK